MPTDTVAAHHNPFRAARVLERVRFLDPHRPGVPDWGALVARLDALGGCGAVIGPHGTGKTTFLEDLAAHLRDEHGMATTTVTLCRERTRPTRDERDAVRAAGRRGDAVMIDGADLLSWLDRRRAFAAARGARYLVISAHGRSPLPALLETHASPRLLARILDDLAPGAIDDAAAATMLDEHDGNVREVIRALYDRAMEG